MKFSIQIIKCHQNQQVHGILLVCTSKRYYFNFPEPQGRFQSQLRIKPSNGFSVFFTRNCSDSVSGIIPMITDLVETDICLESKFYCPQKTLEFFEVTKTQYGRKILPYAFYDIQNHSKCNLGLKSRHMMVELERRPDFGSIFFGDLNQFIKKNIKDADINDPSKFIDKDRVFVEDQIQIQPIVLTHSEAIGYLVFMATSETQVDFNAVIAAGIDQKNIGKFKKDGELQVGDQTYYLKDFQVPEEPPVGVLILDIRDVQEVLEFQSHKEIEKLFKVNQQQSERIETKLSYVIHDAPINILMTKEYSEFLQKFDNQYVLHIFTANEIVEKVIDLQECNLTFKHAKKNNIYYKKVPQFFPYISSVSEDQFYLEEKEKELQISKEGQPIFKLESMFQFIKNQSKAQNLFEIDIFPFQGPQYALPFQPKPELPTFMKYEADFNNQIDTILKSEQYLTRSKSEFTEQIIKGKFDPEIIFLGTSCMLSSTYRNVSGTLIFDEQSDFALLFDCGDSIYYQIINSLGERRTGRMFECLKLVLISHFHSDHYLGVTNLMTHRNKYFQSIKATPPPIYLVVPYVSSSWIYGFMNQIENLNVKIIFIQDLDLKIDEKTNTYDRNNCQDYQNMEKPIINVTEPFGVTQPVKKEKKQEQKEKNKTLVEKKPEEKTEELQLSDHEEETKDGEVQTRHEEDQFPVSDYNYYKRFEQNRDLEKISPVGELAKTLKEYQQFLDQNGILQLLFVPVIHIMQSYGMCFIHKSRVQISFSGDQRPCESFNQLARGSTLMIHEATFSDDLIVHAKKARHSTLTEAINAAITSNSQFLAITHFSRRHQKIIIDEITDNNLVDFCNSKLVIASDHFCFQLSLAPLANLVSKAHTILDEEDD